MRSASPPSNTASETCGTLAEPGREPRETKPAASRTAQVSRTRLSPTASKLSSSASATLSAYPLSQPLNRSLHRSGIDGSRQTRLHSGTRVSSHDSDVGEETVLAFQRLLQAMRA